MNLPIKDTLAAATYTVGGYGTTQAIVESNLAEDVKLYASVGYFVVSTLVLLFDKIKFFHNKNQ